MAWLALARHEARLYLVDPFIISPNESGDSYSAIGYDIDLDFPSKKNPIGNPPFPGYTYVGGANWVSAPKSC